MKLITSTNKLNQLHADFDQTLSVLATSIVNGLGVLPECNGIETAYTVPNQFLTLETADLLHSKGVQIKGFPLFIEIASKTDDCPFIDGTWEDWKLDNHTFYEVDGRIFIGTNAHTNDDMDWADLQILRDKLVLPSNLPLIE